MVSYCSKISAESEWTLIPDFKATSVGGVFATDSNTCYAAYTDNDIGNDKDIDSYNENGDDIDNGDDNGHGIDHDIDNGKGNDTGYCNSKSIDSDNSTSNIASN